MTIKIILLLIFAQTSMAQTPSQERAPASYIPPTIQERVDKKDGKKTEDKTPETIDSAQEPDGEPDYGITGDWGGVRKSLEDWGVSLSVYYKGDLTKNTDGGLQKKTSYLDNLDLKAALDMEKLVGLSGMNIFIYGLRNSGADHANTPTAYVGDLQGTSNIETGVDDFRLYQAYVEQVFFEDRFSILVGLHDLNSEFYVTPTATLFLNSSFGVGHELAQTGNNGPAIFPYTAPAIRIKTESKDNQYLEVGVFNAQAGHPTKTTGTHLRANAKDGRLVIAEYGFTGVNEHNSQYSLGYWSYSEPFDHLITGDKVGSSGTYLSLDHGFTDSLSAFIRYGIASTKSNPMKDNLSLGVAMKGLIPHREDDALGLGFTRVSAGDPFLEINPTSGKFESTWELTYRIELAPGMVLQPDLQYVINPGLDTTLDNSVVTSIRFEVGL